MSAVQVFGASRKEYRLTAFVPVARHSMGNEGFIVAQPQEFIESLNLLRIPRTNQDSRTLAEGPLNKLNNDAFRRSAHDPVKNAIRHHLRIQTGPEQAGPGPTRPSRLPRGGQSRTGT